MGRIIVAGVRRIINCHSERSEGYASRGELQIPRSARDDKSDSNILFHILFHPTNLDGETSYPQAEPVLSLPPVDADYLLSSFFHPILSFVSRE
jgi:hypothetical protein